MTDVVAQRGNECCSVFRWRQDEIETENIDQAEGVMSDLADDDHVMTCKYGVDKARRRFNRLDRLDNHRNTVTIITFFLIRNSIH